MAMQLSLRAERGNAGVALRGNQPFGLASPRVIARMGHGTVTEARITDLFSPTAAIMIGLRNKQTDRPIDVSSPIWLRLLNDSAWSTALVSLDKPLPEARELDLGALSLGIVRVIPMKPLAVDPGKDPRETQAQLRYETEQSLETIIYARQIKKAFQGTDVLPALLDYLVMRLRAYTSWLNFHCSDTMLPSVISGLRRLNVPPHTIVFFMIEISRIFGRGAHFAFTSLSILLESLKEARFRDGREVMTFLRTSLELLQEKADTLWLSLHTRRINELRRLSFTFPQIFSLSLRVAQAVKSDPELGNDLFIFHLIPDLAAQLGTRTNAPLREIRNRIKAIRHLRKVQAEHDSRQERERQIILTLREPFGTLMSRRGALDGYLQLGLVLPELQEAIVRGYRERSFDIGKTVRAIARFNIGLADSLVIEEIKNEINIWGAVQTQTFSDLRVVARENNLPCASAFFNEIDAINDLVKGFEALSLESADSLFSPLDITQGRESVSAETWLFLGQAFFDRGRLFRRPNAAAVVIAALREMKEVAVSPQLKDRLQNLAESFYEEVLGRIGHDSADEYAKLIAIYRTLCIQTCPTMFGDLVS